MEDPMPMSGTANGIVNGIANDKEKLMALLMLKVKSLPKT